MTTQGLIEIVKGRNGVFSRTPKMHFDNFGQNVNFKSITSAIPSDSYVFSKTDFKNTLLNTLSNMKTSSKITALGCSFACLVLLLAHKLYNRTSKKEKH